MNRLPRNLVGLVLACVLCACSSAGGEATQVIVVIDAQSAVRASAAKLRMLVQSAPDGSDVYDRTLLRSRGEIVLPYVLALVPKDGDASRRFQVVATVHDENDEFVAQVRAIGGYVEHRRVVLWLMLEDSCAHVSCPADETCSAGSCGSALVDPEALDPLDEVDLPDGEPIDSNQPETDAGAAGTGMSGAGGTSATGGTSGGGGTAGRGGSAGGGQGGSAGEPAACDDGDQQACGSSEGECSPGTQTCSDGEWGACTGEVGGSPEQCDGEDDDCDGTTDEQAPCDASALPHSIVAACVLGACRAFLCEAQWGDCNIGSSDGCEQPLTTLEHCGACGDACTIANASESCATGSCLVTACHTGWDDCDEDGESCETQLGTVDDCSACGDECAFTNANAQCADNSGVRSCQFAGCVSSRFRSCDGLDSNGCEIDLQTDPNHCGACNYDCETKANVESATCTGSACAFDCASDYLDCDGDPDNGCEHDYGTSGICPRCFGSGTSNFAADSYTYTASVAFNCGGTHTFNSTTRTWDTACCGTCPTAIGPLTQTAAGGPQVVILTASALQVASGTTLRLVGQYPVIFAVEGDAAIAGVIDASASGAVPGPGGNFNCGASTGTDGSGSDVFGASGGGGGGFGTAGGIGGTGDFGSPGAGGVARGPAALSPLIGGCGGGNGGDCTEVLGGAGGGAFQLSVAGVLTVSGTLRANGGAGQLGCGNGGGGSGGGAGGAILLEASRLETASATLLTSGGPGGMGAGSLVAGGAGSTSATAPGSPGASDADDGGSGGGGGHGRLNVRDCLAP